MDGLSGKLQRRYCLKGGRGFGGRCAPGRARRIESYRPVDILKQSLAEIVERKVRVASDLLEGAAGKAHAARLAFVLDPSRNVDAVAEDIVAVDDNIANIDPDTERDRRNDGFVAFGHLALHGYCASNGIYGAGKFHRHAVAGRLDDASVVIGDRWIDNLAAMGLERFQRPDVVSTLRRE